jgi:ketosteroid isomerase-like protein
MPDLTRHLIDRFQIADVLALFCERIDAYDIDGVAVLFTEDCVTDYGPGRGGPLKGREAFRQRLWRSQSIYRHTHHQIGQVRQELDGDSATTVTYLTAWHETFGGQVAVARIQYRDAFVRQSDHWLIAHRAAVALGVTGFPTEDWNWVARAAPRPNP